MLPICQWAGGKENNFLQFTVMRLKENDAFLSPLSLCVSWYFFKSSEGRSWWWILKQITLIIVLPNCQLRARCPPPVASHASRGCRPFLSQKLSPGNVSSPGMLLNRLRGLLDRREIYGWHFVTINQELLIKLSWFLCSYTLPKISPCVWMCTYRHIIIIICSPCSNCQMAHFVTLFD